MRETKIVRDGEKAGERESEQTSKRERYKMHPITVFWLIVSPRSIVLKNC